MALVRQIMTQDPVTVLPETRAEDVFHTLRQHELPGVPVVDGDGKLQGIITESDLVISDDEEDLHIPHYIELFGGLVFLEPLRRFESRLHKAVAATAAEMMTANPTTVEADDSARKAARMIADTGHNRLPVVEGGRLVGVVTRVDVLNALAGEGE